MAEISADINKAKILLESGQLVAIPTETVYGLAGNAFSGTAVAEIFAVKDRPYFDPLIIHTNNIERIENWVENFPYKAYSLATSFMPGPLTLLLNKKEIIPDLVTSGMHKVAVRVPDHLLTLQLLKILDFPLAAPSANPFGYISPTNPVHVQNQLGAKIPFILDGGEAKVGIESTIVGFEQDKIIIYRLGGLSVEEIEAVVGKVSVMKNSSSNPLSPGMLKSHYAPRKKLYISNLEPLIKKNNPDKIGALVFDQYLKNIPEKNQIILSKTADLSEAARNLFSSLRELDQMDIDFIYAELLPEVGLGRAINDRLRRAAA